MFGKSRKWITESKCWWHLSLRCCGGCCCCCYGVVTSTKVVQRSNRCPPHPCFAPPSADAMDSRLSNKSRSPAQRIRVAVVVQCYTTGVRQHAIKSQWVASRIYCTDEFAKLSIQVKIDSIRKYTWKINTNQVINNCDCFDAAVSATRRYNDYSDDSTVCIYCAWMDAWLVRCCKLIAPNSNQFNGFVWKFYDLFIVVRTYFV